MPALRGAAQFLAVAAAALSVALIPTGAYASRGGDGNRGQVHQGGGSHDGSISATAGGVRFSTPSSTSSGSVGSLTSTTNWSPPACWYVPKYTPKQLKQQYQELLNEPEFSGKGEAATAFKYTYIDGHPYKNFNMAKQGKGYWWDWYIDPTRSGDPTALSCTHPIFWVDKGQTPTVPNAVTPQVLAQLAYARIRVPATKVRLNPAGLQTVNLNTWAWAVKSAFKPVSVTASVPVLGISATTTATPVALHLDPGTPDADVYPASGDCPIKADGSIGTPYTAADANGIPRCGLTYRHATTGRGPYELKATLTWQIKWTGTGGAGGNVPDGVFGTTTRVTVQEDQTVVR